MGRIATHHKKGLGKLARKHKSSESAILRDILEVQFPKKV